MTHVDKIVVDVTTKNVSDAGTNGLVYLGIGGREFRLDKPGDQFKRGATDKFTIGIDSDVESSDINDLPLDPGPNGKSPEIEDSVVTGTNMFPVYIRLDPKNDEDNDWNIEKVKVDAVAGFGTGTGATRTFVFPKPTGGHPEGTIWLGTSSGLTLFLEQQ